MQGVLGQVKELHSEQRYLDAYALTQKLWGDPKSLAHLNDADSLIVISHLSDLLGAGKLSEALARRAAKRFPDNSWVEFNYAQRIHGFKHHYDRLKFYDSNPVEESGISRLDGLVHAQRAVDWAYVREFGLAHHHLEKAFGFDCDPARLHHYRARVLLSEDRPADALADAEKAFELKPLATYTVEMLNRVLARLNRYEDAAEQTWAMAKDGQVQTYRYIQTVMRSQGALVDRSGSGELAERMLFLSNELERTAPLADGQTQRSIRLSRIDAYLQNDRLDAAAELAEETEHAFYNKVFRRYRKRKPDARQIVHPHQPVLQDRMHCLPASVSVILSHFGASVSQHDIAAELTMEGTSVGEMGHWLRDRGYQAVHFMITEESARAVLDHGIPFVYHETYESSAHSMAMVGIDERLGVFLIHDPGYHRLTQLVASSISDGEAPIGAHGMVVLPADADAPPLKDEWVQPAEAYFEFFEVCSSSGLDAGEKIVDELATAFPEHPMTRYLQAELYNRRGRYSEAQDLLMDLFEAHPRCVYFRRLLLSVLRSLDNTGLMREVLREIVRKGSVRGVKPNKKFRLTMATYKCQYADYVRMSADGLGEAHRYINMALRQEPASSEPYHILGDILMEEERAEEAILAYWVASRLAPHSSHYAHACFEQLKRFRGRDEALRFMKERAEQLGRHPRGMDAWDDYVRALDEADDPQGAVDEMKALLEVHADNYTAHSYAGKLFARLGEWDLAWDSVNKLNTGRNETLYLSAILDLFWYQRELEPGLGLAERWLELEPWNRDARWAVLRFSGALHDRETSFAYAEKWYQEMPGNEMIENIYLNRLRFMDRRERKIEVLRLRVERNPKDAWGWRELGFDYAAEMTGIEGDAFESARTGLLECIEKSKALSPGWGSIALQAELAEAEGRGRDALDLWLEALTVSPDYEYAMQRTWDLSSGLGGETKKNVLERLRSHLSSRVDVGDTKLIYSVSDRYGFSEAAELFLNLKERFPNAPELESCKAWLVLDYSGGELDLGSRADMLAGLEDARKRYASHRGIVMALAATYRRDDRLEEASRLLSGWVELNRTDTDAVRRLVRILEEQGCNEDIEKLLRRTLAECPEEAAAYDMLGQFLGRNGQLDEAVGIYQKGLNRLPEDIGLREESCDFCLNYGYDALAVEIAREGTKVYPEGAYLWFQYGRALHRSEWTDDVTDPVDVLRKALKLNSTLYNAADQLAVILNGRSRYEEALHVMASFVDDPENSLYARSRLVYIRRCRAEALSDDEGKKEAVGEAMSIADEAPNYEWIWRRLIDWIGEDESWDLAKEVFAELPPVMQTAPYFRSSRLQLLRKAGEEGLTDEWYRLLSEYPRDQYLHNDCFDEFWEERKHEEAVAVLDALYKRNWGTIWTDIRLVQAYAKLDRIDEALETCRRVWLSAEDLSMEDDNASIFSWNRIHEGSEKLRKRIVDDFLGLLTEKEYVRPGAIRKFCDIVDESGDVYVRQLVWKTTTLEGSPSWLAAVRWLLTLLVLGVPRSRLIVRKSIMKILLSREWTTGVHFAGVIIAGAASRESSLIADYLLKKRPGIDKESMNVWGACSYVYYEHRPQWLLKNMADWRERAGAKTWQIMNYLSLHHQKKPKDAEVRLKDSLEVLSRFGHAGNTAAYAWLALDSAFRLERFDEALHIYQTYEMYLGREVREDEFIPTGFKYMPDIYPHFIQLLEGGWTQELECGYTDSWDRWEKRHWISCLWTLAKKESEKD